LQASGVSDMLSVIGDERIYRDFFKAYAPLLSGRDNGEDILIDSTGLPNSIHFPLTAISNHNGEISNETRLIYVLQQNSNLPLFFRYCPGNIVDVSTLTRTLLELKAYNINVSHAILDAGYLTEDNVRDLYDAKVSFLSRLKQNTNLYKSVVEAHLHDLQNEENIVSYNTRYAYIKRVEVDYFGRTAYVYLGLDKAMQSLESSKLFARAKSKKMTDKDVHAAMTTQGIFALVSSRPIAHDKVLPFYYTRQQIEQVFDICKNNTNMLPLRVQKEATFRGHLLITFLASVVVRMLQQDIRETAYTPESAQQVLRNQKCKVFKDCVITQEATKKANDVYPKFQGRLSTYKAPTFILVSD
jgi:transposase